jgi:hypothetical protein
MRGKILLLTFVISALLASCATTPTASPSPSASVKPSVSPNASASPSASAGVSASASAGASQTPSDSTTSASIVNTASAFENAISKNGTWIICLTQDLTDNKDLKVDGNFMNKKTPPTSQRKLAFYAQDENRKVTASYTLTAPKMTINSIDCAIWNGTFKGDLYVSAENFQLIGATVEGNVYFTNASAQSTFKMDANSKITGTQQLKTS